jgi:hypothetical protein
MASSDNAIDPTLYLMMTPTTTRTLPRKKANGKASPATEQTTTKKNRKTKTTLMALKLSKSQRRKIPIGLSRKINSSVQRG